MRKNKETSEYYGNKMRWHKNEGLYNKVSLYIEYKTYILYIETLILLPLCVVAEGVWSINPKEKKEEIKFLISEYYGN